MKKVMNWKLRDILKPSDYAIMGGCFLPFALLIVGYIWVMVHFIRKFW